MMMYSDRNYPNPYPDMYDPGLYASPFQNNYQWGINYYNPTTDYGYMPSVPEYWPYMGTNIPQSYEPVLQNDYSDDYPNEIFEPTYDRYDDILSTIPIGFREGIYQNILANKTN